MYQLYAYDEEGRLVKDLQEEIEHIVWRVDGKVKSITRTPSSEKNVSFDYNSFGQRVAKHVYDNQTDMLERSTYYVLDAQGQQLSMYEHIVDSSEVKYHLAERNVYGSSRLGVAKDTVNMYDPDLLPSYGIFSNRNYEFSNHLGNVLTVISDFVAPIDEDLNEEVDGYQVSLAMVADYSPFGVQLDGRTNENTGYRYGFQNQEIDNEIKGEGNSVNYKYRMHDPRIGRFFAVDPLFREYPHNSPYAFSENNVIHAIELEGLEKVEVYNQWYDEKGNFQKKHSHTYVDNALKENVYLYDNYNSKGKVNYKEYVGQESGRTYVAPVGQVDNYTLYSAFNGEDKTGSAYPVMSTGEYRGPIQGGSISAEAEVNTTPLGGTTFGVKAIDDGTEQMEFKAEATRNVLYLSSNPQNVEASIKATAEFQIKKSYSGDNPYTTEGEISLNIGYLSISGYGDSDGGYGLRISVGVSTSKSRIPVTATMKIKEN